MIKTRLIKSVPESKKYIAANVVCQLVGLAAGTAAVISPVGELCWKDEKVTLGDGSIGPVAQKLYDTLTGIQYGRLPDENGWIVKL